MRSDSGFAFARPAAELTITSRSWWLRRAGSVSLRETIVWVRLVSGRTVQDFERARNASSCWLGTPGQPFVVLQMGQLFRDCHVNKLIQ